MSEETKKEKAFLDLVHSIGDLPASEEELHQWMLQHLQGAGKVPEGEAKSDNTGENTEIKADDGLPKVHTSRLFQETPKLSSFSGDPSSKGDASFDIWKYEVKCLSPDVFSTSSILQAVRKSLKGEAARVVMRLGVSATVAQILEKLESVYGIVDAGETILAQFYAAKQGVEENVSTWAFRLEGLLDKAKEVGQIVDRDVDEMLRSRFWMGLRHGLRQTSRHKYDTVPSFDKLRVEIRKIEQEFKLVDQPVEKGTDGTAKMTNVAGAKQKDGEVTELKGLVHKLTNHVENMRQEFQKMKPPIEARQQPQLMHPQSQVRPAFNYMPYQQQQPAGRPPQQHGQQAGGGYIRATGDGMAPPQVGNNMQGRPPSCWNCGQADHLKKDCPYFVCWGCNQHGHVRRNCPHPLNL